MLISRPAPSLGISPLSDSILALPGGYLVREGLVFHVKIFVVDRTVS